MQGPVIYHGASNGNGPWPTGGGGSVSQLTRTVFFDAGQLVPYQDHIFSNPPRLGNNEMWAGTSHYSRGMLFDGALAGERSFCSFVASLPANFDPAVVPTYREAFWMPSNGHFMQTVFWEMQVATERNLQQFSPSGAWADLHTATAFPWPALQWSPLVAVAPDNLLAPSQAGDLLNVFLSRASDGISDEVPVLGVEMNYRIMP
jgi:hypothetical protein